MQEYYAKNERLELKTQFPPPIKSYLPISIISSIASANQGNTSWILNNFIQLFIPDQKEKLESFPFQDFMYYDQNIFQVNSINDNNHIFKPENIIDELIYWLEHNNYVVVYADEYKVPFTRHYKYAHMLHSQFIYGYDINTQVFLTTNFLRNSRLEKFTISFEDLKASIFSESTLKLFKTNTDWVNRDTLHRIILIRYLENRGPFFEHGVNKDYILNEINNYCKSYNSSNYSCFFTGKLEGTWGIDVYAKIIDIIEKKPQMLDRRMFHLLYEHKLFMIERLKLFHASDKSIEEFRKVLKSTEILKMLCIKYNFKQNINILKNMVDLLNDIKTKEECVLLELLDQNC